MNVCKWIRNDSTQCVLIALDNKNYCKLHKKFEDIYSPDVLHTLLRCKRCKKICDELNDKEKCIKCSERQKRGSETRTKDKVKCCWINQKSQPCPWNALDNETLCKRHMKYKEQTLEDMIKCSTCKNLFTSTEKYKTCISCRNRGETNRKIAKENRLYCKAIILNTGKQCEYKQCDENEYCKLHQTYKKYKDLVDAGFRVCSNIMRGCTNILDDNDKSRCKTCKLLANNTKNSTSNTLYEVSYSRYKTEAKRRNKSWDISKEDAIQLFTNKCHYCDYFNGINGIDRIDNDKGYFLSNVVSCCKYCNIMKNKYSYDAFKKNIIHLFNVLCNNNQETNTHIDTFMRSNSFSYGGLVNSAKKRKIIVLVTEEQCDKLAGMECYYCKNHKDTGCNGIDRINSNKPYSIDNVVPCCRTCNIMKNDMDTECFKMKIRNVYKKFIENTSVDYDVPRTKILTMLTNYNIKCCNFKPARLYKEPDYYCEKIFNGDIKDVSLELEFVDSSNKLLFSIWQFYRRYISSFKKKANSGLVGKQVYILVKDRNTNTYLGIVSLTSDIKYLQSRDKYIGWNSKEYLTNGSINYIMNISTCVSTQPFGYNYNGGKLLTSLVYSKEVLQHIKDKYDLHIQGFTTMSLYGKSIQYDRLPRIKFVGYTKGTSLTNVPADIPAYCKDYLKNNGYTNPKDNLWAITKTFRKLDIPIEDFLKGCKKGIYFGFTHKNSQDFLQGKNDIEPNPIETAQPAQEIYNWWLQRWGQQRYSHLKNTNRVKKYEDCVKDIMTQLDE